MNHEPSVTDRPQLAGVPPINTPEPLITWEPIAEALQMKERAFWKLVHEQGLPHYRLNGRVIRFRWSECERWLEAARKGAA